MTRPAFRLRPEARRRLLDFFDSSRNRWSEAQAETPLAGFKKAFQQRVAFPESGAPGSQICKLRCQKHLVRRVPDGIEVGTIVDQRQELLRELESYERFSERQARRERVRKRS